MSEATIELTIDGEAVSVPDGSTILEAIHAAGKTVPTLCWLPRSGPWASCLLCSVEVENMRRLVPSCATPAQAGQVVRTATEQVQRHRKLALELLLSDHVGDCVAPCQSGCPAHLDVPGMNRAISEGDMDRAAEIVRDTIPLPATLGRICPAPCEGRCRRKGTDGALSVCLLKRHVGDHEIEAGGHAAPALASPTGKRVAVIGSGPSGLSAAYFLLRHGNGVAIFDQHDEPGGALRYEISEETLPRHVLDAEIDRIRAMGAEFHLGQRVDVHEVRKQFDAVILAVGTLAEGETPEGLARANRGLRVTKGTGETSIKGVFAAGGSVAPGKISIRSVGDAHTVADSVHHFLTGERLPPFAPFNLEVDKTNTRFVEARLKMVDQHPRTEPKHSSLSDEEAKLEASRCLQCGCAKADTCELRALAGRFGLDPAKFKGSTRPIRIDDSHDEIVFEESKCISCGICVRVAAVYGESLGLSFRGRGFDTRVGPPFGEPLAKALQKAARACAEQCPTGALYLRANLPHENPSS